jgi:hypothetical protein
MVNPMNLSTHDRDILRRLAMQQAEIAALPIQKEKAELWRRLNDLERVRPLVWINEIPWNEMNVGDELTLGCTHPWAMQQEWGLRILLYQWQHMPADMVVDDFLTCPLVVNSSGFGLTPEEDVLRTDFTSEVVSHRYKTQLRCPNDIDKIREPVVTYDKQATEEDFEQMCAIYDGILPVHKAGIKGVWFSPWDRLVECWGAEQLFVDLVEKPELVEMAVSRYVSASLAMLDQWEVLNLLARNDNNTRIGSGGYGYTTQLPCEGYKAEHLQAHDLWGCATAQIFGSVSPHMHWEFALKHEMRWLERWGLTYYGCCEPLDNKMDILRRIPNLRKISMSPWVNVERAAGLIRRDYVFSRKPSPAFLAEDDWRPAAVRADLVDCLEKANGCNVEIILKDISTLRYQPQRLWEWNQVAMEVVEDYAP